MNRYKKIPIRILQTVLILLCTQTLFAQKVVRYELYVKDTLVNYAGKQKRAIAVNGQIPMPALTFVRLQTKLDTLG
ncbi:hypothetical protein [Olivibacter sp. XZL3]|uniref:hypothetical protein n=1 Tax=Olivibacter sp. XZL3 TaxID=1735116 RepID=UPI001F0D02A9|nr:hypothetical protein [Olivibacter sp. XZL3]